MTGIEVLLEILARAGVRYVFGNPGSMELPLTDALGRDARFRYIFGLQEVPLVAMADGYAMASGQLGVVNVHIACGLGNAMGMLYNAYREGTPLLLTAGQQDRRLRLSEPVLEGDLVRVAQPWTKWAYEVPRAADMAGAVRRAVQLALTPPTGPVFLALPIDVQQEPVAQADLSPPWRADRRVRPPAEALQQAAAVLASARCPAILAGSRVTEAGAVSELVAVAERLGAAVFTESSAAHGRLPIPADHPLLAEPLSLWSPEVRRQLEPHDVLLVVGMDLLRLYLYQEPACPLPEHARLVQLDLDPWQIAKNYPVEVGLIGDPQAGLAELRLRLEEVLDQEQAARARQRLAEHVARREADRASLQAAWARQQALRPMTALTLMTALGRVLPGDAAVVEEAVTTHQHLHKRMGVLKDPSGHFAHRGWALGWGLGCALGVKLAWPQRPVLGLLGDGSALFGIQGLWTAAHERIPVAWVIANNAQYQILKDCSRVLQLPGSRQPRQLGTDLVDPEIDFVGLAGALGVEAVRVSEPDEVSDRLRQWLAEPRPLLLDVPLERGDHREPGP